MVSLGATYWRVHSMFHNTSESWGFDVNTTGLWLFHASTDLAAPHWRHVYKVLRGHENTESIRNLHIGLCLMPISLTRLLFPTLCCGFFGNIPSPSPPHQPSSSSSSTTTTTTTTPAATATATATVTVTVTATTQRNTTQHNWRQFRKIWDLQNMDLKCTQNETSVTSMCEQEAWEDAKIMQNKAALLQER